MSRTRHHGDKQKKRLFGRFWFWLRSEPSWWHKMKTHIPARAKEKAMLHRLEEENYPDRKKPHDYYW